MNEVVQGHNGELIDRLLVLLDDSPTEDPAWWYSTSFVVALHIGGQQLSRITPDTGTPVPGSRGAERRALMTVVSREDWFDLIRTRLGELVSDGLGVAEDFLVKALRNLLDEHLTRMADTGTSDTNRAEMRAALEDAADDPTSRAAFRERISESDAALAGLSDEQIVAELMAAAAMFDPTTPNEALDRWAVKGYWERRRADALSDEVMEGWRIRWLERQSGSN